MHIKFREIIFFIAFFIVICFTLTNRAAMSDGGMTLRKSDGAMSLHLDKEIHYVGDVIPIYYSYPPTRKNLVKESDTI